MKVKIGDQEFNSKDVAICILLSDTDKSNIANMLPTATRYAVFPDSDTRSADEMLAWMDLK